VDTLIFDIYLSDFPREARKIRQKEEKYRIDEG